jgi:ribonuclease BN (tRNA processing enzyme)
VNRLTILGCSAGSPQGEAPASGYLLEVEGRRLLLDCGPGVVAAAAASGGLERLDAVIVTHRHADHCADLVALAYHRCFPRVLPPLPLFAPTGFDEVLTGLDRIWGIPTLEDLRKPLTSAFDLRMVDPGDDLEIAGLSVTTHRTLHPVPTMALRSDDASLAYTADAALTPELADFCQDVTLLLAEATYLELPEAGVDAHGHMDGAAAGELAAKADAAHLVLTHFADPREAPAILEAATLPFSGRCDIATPGRQLVLPKRQR